MQKTAIRLALVALVVVLVLGFVPLPFGALCPSCAGLTQAGDRVFTDAEGEGAREPALALTRGAEEAVTRATGKALTPRWVVCTQEDCAKRMGLSRPATSYLGLAVALSPEAGRGEAVDALADMSLRDWYDFGLSTPVPAWKRDAIVTLAMEPEAFQLDSRGRPVCVSRFSGLVLLDDAAAWQRQKQESPEAPLMQAALCRLQEDGRDSGLRIQNRD